MINHWIKKEIEVTDVNGVIWSLKFKKNNRDLILSNSLQEVVLEGIDYETAKEMLVKIAKKLSIRIKMV